MVFLRMPLSLGRTPPRLTWTYIDEDTIDNNNQQMEIEVEEEDRFKLRDYFNDMSNITTDSDDTSMNITEEELNSNREEYSNTIHREQYTKCKTRGAKGHKYFSSSWS